MMRERASVSDMSPDNMETCLTDIVRTVLEWKNTRKPPKIISCGCDEGAIFCASEIESILDEYGLLETTTEIDSFRGEYDFLSNFYPAAVTYEGRLYPTTEHAFQAAKTLDQVEREKIRRAETPGKSKKMGNEVKLRKDWESVKYSVMLDVVRKKFQHPELRERLLATGDAKLIEGNTWNDTTWGVCNGRGKNWLGRILMDVRNEIQEDERE